MIDLVAWRKARGLTQVQAAESLAITERHYRRLETGRAPINKRVAMLARLAGHFDNRPYYYPADIDHAADCYIDGLSIDDCAGE
jgi:transcriptional regulator with XRE-family HTH domain